VSERNTAAIRARLSDAEPEVRRLAAKEIPTLPAPDSCDLLLTALGDDDWRVRKEAAMVATHVEPRTGVVFALTRALGEHDNVGLRNAAVEALVSIGPDAVPGAIDALARLDPDGRKLAVEVLAGAPTLAGVRELVRATADPDVNVVVACAEALGHADLAGEEARELASAALAELLSSPHPSVRVAALAAGRTLEQPVPWSRLEPLLEDNLTRRSALAAAAGNLAPRALLAFCEAIADPNPTVAREATAALGRSLEEGWGDEQLFEVAIKMLRASQTTRTRLRALATERTDAAARGAAILALGLVRDPDDVSLIADAMADDEVADRAEAALRLFGHDAVEPLLVAGRTAAPSVRAAAISMLPELAPSESEPLAAFRDALADPSPEVVAPALKSLAIVGVAGDLARVAHHACSSDSKVAAAAQGALVAIATRHPGPARVLLEDIDPRGEQALWASILRGALARAGSVDRTDMEFLASALTHREAAVRRAAVDALGDVGGDEAVEAVTVSLGDEEAIVALAAIRALGRLRRAEQLASLAATTKDPIRLGTVLRALREADPERAFAAARPLLRSSEPSVAAAAVDVVGSVASLGQAEALLSAADHPDHEVVRLALGELAKLDDERSHAAIASAIDHPAESVRKCAAELLGQTGSEGESILRARLDRERSADVRRAIMQALAARPAGTSS
jgi:HEAT repeat protein